MRTGRPEPRKPREPRPATHVRQIECVDPDEVIAYYRRKSPRFGKSIAETIAQLTVHDVPITVELLDYLESVQWRVVRDEDTVGRLDGVRYAEAQRRRREDSWVYFIQHDGRIKIGVSVDPAARAVSLSLRWQDVIAVIKADDRVERSLHARFAEHRIGTTEWFTDCPEIRAYIDAYADRFTPQHPAYKTAAKREPRPQHVRKPDAYSALLRAIAKDRRLADDGA